MEFDDRLKSVWMDLTQRFKEAARRNDTETCDAIFNTIYNLEKVYPHMQEWYLHTFPGEE